MPSFQRPKSAKGALAVREKEKKETVKSSPTEFKGQGVRVETPGQFQARKETEQAARDQPVVGPASPGTEPLTSEPSLQSDVSQPVTESVIEPEQAQSVAQLLAQGDLRGALSTLAGKQTFLDRPIFEEATTGLDTTVGDIALASAGPTGLPSVGRAASALQATEAKSVAATAGAAAKRLGLSFQETKLNLEAARAATNWARAKDSFNALSRSLNTGTVRTKSTTKAAKGVLTKSPRVGKSAKNTKTSRLNQSYLSKIASTTRNPALVAGVLASILTTGAGASVGTKLMAEWASGENTDTLSWNHAKALEVGDTALATEIEQVMEDLANQTLWDEAKDFIPVGGFLDELALKFRAGQQKVELNKQEAEKALLDSAKQSELEAATAGLTAQEGADAVLAGELDYFDLPDAIVDEARQINKNKAFEGSKNETPSEKDARLRQEQFEQTL